LPRVIDGLAGVTAIDTKLTDATLTFSVVEPLIEPEAAVIAVEPMANAVARPWLMVATDGVPEDQITDEVMSFVPPSV